MIGGATVIWVLFEVLDYHLLTLISHVLIGVLAVLFLWSKSTSFIKKSVPSCYTPREHRLHVIYMIIVSAGAPQIFLWWRYLKILL